MRALTIVVAGAAPDRFRAAMGMALTHQALGGAARLFLDTAAVLLLRAPVADARDPDYAAAGLPTLAGLVEETLAAGITLTLCQAGLALAALTPAELDPRLDYGGMVGLLATLGEAERLIVA